MAGIQISIQIQTGNVFLTKLGDFIQVHLKVAAHLDRSLVFEYWINLVWENILFDDELEKKWTKIKNRHKNHQTPIMSRHLGIIAITNKTS